MIEYVIAIGVVGVALGAILAGYVLLKRGHAITAQDQLLRIDRLEQNIAALQRDVLRLERLTSSFDRHRIKAGLIEHFDMGEMRGLLFDLDLRLDDFPHRTQGELIDALISYCERHRCTDRLLAVLRRTRPAVKW